MKIPEIKDLTDEQLLDMFCYIFSKEANIGLYPKKLKKVKITIEKEYSDDDNDHNT